MKSLLASLLFAIISVSVTAAPAQAQSAVAPVACTPASAGSFVIEQAQILLSHDEGGAFIGPVATSVPAGSYELSTMSFEDHIGSGDPTQDNETWYFEGYNNGSVVYTSPVTTDLPDDINVLSDNFGVVAIPELDAIRWVHAAFPDPTYQSVYPSCIDFAPVEVEQPVVHTCEIAFTVDELMVMGMATITPAIDQSVVEYDFGDGSAPVTVAADEKATHTYSEAGTYTITASTTHPDTDTVISCETEVTVVAPVVDDEGSVLGTTDETDGSVLGTTDENGNVLGANDVLANTGIPALVNIVLGLALISVAYTTTSSSKAENR